MTNLIILLLIWCTGMVSCYAWFVGLLLRRTFDDVIVSEPVAARAGEASGSGNVLSYAEPPRRTGLLRRWPTVAMQIGILAVLVPMSLPMLPLLLTTYWDEIRTPGIVCLVALALTALAVVWVSHRGLRSVAGRPGAANWRHLGRAVLCWLAVLLMAWAGLEFRVERILDDTLAKAGALRGQFETDSPQAGIAASLYDQAGVPTLGELRFDDGWDLVTSSGRIAPPPPFPEEHAFRIPLLRQAAVMETSGLTPPLSTITINTRLNHIVGLHVATTFLHRHAISEARAGRIESAIADINALYGMAGQMEQGSCIIETYSGFTARRWAADALQYVLQKVEDPKLLDQIHLERPDAHMGVIKRATRVELGVLERRSIALLLRCQTGYFLSNLWLLRSSGGMVVYRIALGESDINLMDQFAEELPAAIPDDPAAAAAVSSALNTRAIAARNQSGVAGQLIPMLGKAVDREVEEVALTELSRAAVAATRFRLQQGRLPGSFEELVQAGLLLELPTDPFDRKPMRFAVHEGYVFIHTIGASRIDNGGMPYMLDPAGDVVQSNPGLILSTRPLWELNLVRRATTRPAEEEP